MNKKKYIIIIYFKKKKLCNGHSMSVRLLQLRAHTLLFSPECCHLPAMPFPASASFPYGVRRWHQPCRSWSRKTCCRFRRPLLKVLSPFSNVCGWLAYAVASLQVDRYVRNGMVIGLGSGCASCLAIQYLGGRLRDGALQDIVGIPMWASLRFNPTPSS